MVAADAADRCFFHLPVSKEPYKMGLNHMSADNGQNGQMRQIGQISAAESKKAKRGPFLKGFLGVGRRQMKSPPKGGHGWRLLRAIAYPLGPAPVATYCFTAGGKWEMAPE